jgi:acyl dehydratase
MALPLDTLGITSPPQLAFIDPDRASAYAAATNDANPAYTSGKLAPPVFAVVPTFELMGVTAAGIIPAEALLFVVHGEHDMHFHQPLAPGQQLRTTATPISVRVGSSGTRLVLKLASVDAATNAPAVDQFATIFVRGMADGGGAGPDKPDHTFPDEARGHPVGEHTIHVDDDQTFRYRDASGDQMPIHVDDAVAKSVGLPGIIAHGLCTMAMTSQAVITLAADGDPARLKRLAVRFAKNVFPGDDVTTTMYEVPTHDSEGANGRKIYAFEATTGRGELVISNGRAEVDA